VFWLPLPWVSDDDEGAAPYEVAMPGESPKAFAAFRFWLSEPPVVRSFGRAARACHVSKNSITRWSRVWGPDGGGWHERAKPHDEARARERDRLQKAALQKADRDRTTAIVGGIEALKIGILRGLRDLREDMDARMSGKDIAVYLQMLSQLSLLQGRATSIEEHKITGESLADLLDRELAEMGDRLPVPEATAEPQDVS
jgi:hypothetical protein